MPVVSVGLLGGLRVEVDGVPVDLGGPKPRRLLAALVASGGRPVTADRLVDLVWPDGPPARAEASLHAYVSNLRRALEPGRRAGEEPRVLVLTPAGYELRLGPGVLDVERFEGAVRSGLALVGSGDVDRGRRLLAAALGSWAPVLPELADAPFTRPLAAGLDDLRLHATEALWGATARVVPPEAVVPDLRAATATDPRSERLWGLLAGALAAAGRRADALAALADARRALAEETGLGPGPELVALEARLLAATDPVPAGQADGRGAVRGGRRCPARHGARRPRTGPHPLAPLRGQGVVRRPRAA